MAQYLDSRGLGIFAGVIKDNFCNKTMLGAHEGIATLDKNGKIPLEQLGNIDTTFVEVVDTLPEEGIGKHLYLVKDKKSDGTDVGTSQNKYAEYIYKGDLPIVVKEDKTSNYIADDWEKLGDFQAEIDLSDYITKDKALNSLSVVRDASKVTINAYNAKDSKNAYDADDIPAATADAAGVMTAADKKALDTLKNRYPLQLSGISISPSVYELGTSIQPKLEWSYSNEDFHTVGSQKIETTDSNIIGSRGLDGNVRSYKQADAYTVPTSATKKTDTLTVKTGDLSKSVNIVGVHAGYCGVVAADKTSLTAAEIVELGNVTGFTGAKVVIDGRGRTVSGVTQTNQKLVYAYPKYFGALTSIKDGNGFQGISGYTQSTVTDVSTVTGGKGTDYYVYIQNTPATATGSYTFA